MSEVFCGSRERGGERREREKGRDAAGSKEGEGELNAVDN